MNQSFAIRRRSQSAAFTLIELLLVLVILAVLAAMVVPKFANRSEQARKTAATADIHALETAIDVFETDNSRYPSSEEGLGALLTAPGGMSTWKGPYIKQLLTDPWGAAYVYRYPGTNNA